MVSVMLDRRRLGLHAAAPLEVHTAAGVGDAFARWHDMNYVQALLRAQVLPQLCPQFAHDHDTIAGEVVDARLHTYLKPASASRSTMTLCYRLTAGTEQPQWITVRAFLDGGSARDHRALRSQGIEALHLEDHDAVAWRLPDDPEMPRLCELLQAGGIAASLAGSTMTTAAVPLRWEVVRYRPMQRCAIAVRAARGAQRPIAFAKIYADERGRHAGGQLSALAATHRSRLADVRVPAPLGYDPQRRTLWLAHFDGHALEASDLHAQNGDLIARLGCSLAQLHRARLPALNGTSPAERLADAHKKATKIRRAYPQTGPILDRAIASAMHGASRLPPATAACIHGDLHLGQWLRGAEALMLADFDELAIGDPELDIANLAVDLQVRGLAAHAADDAIEQFVASYRAAGGPPLAMHRVRWHELLHWINRAYRLFLQQRPGLEAALDRVSAMLLISCDAHDGVRP